MRTPPPRPARPNAKDEAHLLRALCTLTDPREMRRVLADLLTPSEYAALLRRWTILELLNDGTTQRQIAQAIGGSLCNVTRGARILRTGTSSVLPLLPPPSARRRS